MGEPLSRADVEKVAMLARLKLTEEEKEQFAQQLGDVLQYVDILNEVDTTDVEPMAHAVERYNILRPDVPGESLPREDALANACKTDGKYFLVPQIFSQD